VHLESRHARELESWPLGAVRTTERFLSEDKPAKPRQMRELRTFVAGALASAPWLRHAGDRIVGIGGTVRNLAAAVQLAEELPSYGVQGFRIERAALDALVERLAELPADERGSVPGIKPERGDLILAGALVVQGVMEAGAFPDLEATEAGLREGVFFESLLGSPPLFADVRRASVLNLAGQYDTDFAHADHVARLAFAIWDALGEAGLHPGDGLERELLWATAMLHDIGTAVDYDDHHKHSRYLILNAGMPGFSPRETALIGQAARYHRKGNPTLGEFAPLMREGDEAMLRRLSAMLRIAEMLERSRDQAVRGVRVEVEDGRVDLALEADEDVTIARWGAQKQGDVFERAFGRELAVSAS
jgi:exopolyphosphatase/guanosine-5'-triphosphate,3'-diphosphate pyrophosphatase